MGQRGPIPKRTDRPGGYRPETRAKKAESGADGISRPRAGSPSGAPTLATKQPPGSRDWHPIAKRLWKAAGESGQSIYYEASDWMILYSLMDDLTYYKNGAKRSGQMLQTIMSSLTTLLLTEGDRRRLQVELHKNEDVTAVTPGAEEVEKWLAQMSPPSSPTSDHSD